jgi:hypothetical protein
VRKIKRERQTDRQGQTDRETGADRQTDRQTDSKPASQPASRLARTYFVFDEVTGVNGLENPGGINMSFIWWQEQTAIRSRRL